MMTMTDAATFDSALWQRELEAAWGNHAANVRFLGQTGLPKPGMRILEIGCGQGPMMQFLRSLGHDVVGIDPVASRLEVWDHRGRACVADGESLPFPDGSFDLVLSFDVFEHVPDSDRHLRDVARVLRRPGHYLIGTPNKWTNSLIEPIMWAKRFGFRQALHCFEPPGHCSLHNFWQLRDRLSRNGYVPRFFDIPVVNDYFFAKIRRLFGGAGVAAVRLLNPDTLPLYLRTNFYVVAALA
jgi:SAM-dependent methyltransferase